jgi:hypothetical protein
MGIKWDGIYSPSFMSHMGWDLFPKLNTPSGICVNNKKKGFLLLIFDDIDQIIMQVCVIYI